MPIQNNTLIRLASYFSVATASIIIIVKIYAWAATGSLSMLSSLIDSSLDIITSVINLIAIRVSLIPADEDHRFGHGKAEDIAALGQSTFIAGSGIFILYEAFSRMLIQKSINHQDIGIIVMVISSILTIMLISFQHHVIKKTDSNIIKADSLHYKTDLLMNIVVIISLFTSQLFKNNIIDTVIAIFIAIYILKSAYEIAKTSIDKLMDKEFSDEEREKIIKIALSNKDALGIHDLRTRKSGTHIFIQFHLDLNGNLPLSHAHKIADEIEMEVKKEFPNSEIFIHQDPAGEEDIPLKQGHVVSNRLSES